MRISGGLARGIPLQVPKGDAVRPATDGLRQGIFSSIASRLPGATVMDLFAGSGSYGLEALSRGAATCAFVEKNHKAAQCLRLNLEAVCKSAGRTSAGCTVSQADVLSWSPLVKPTLVFVDPPYPILKEIAGPLFEKLAVWLAEVPDPVVIFEMPGEITLSPPGFGCVKRLGREGGRQPTAAFFRKADAIARSSNE